MTTTQEKAITLSLNILNVSFFECPGQHYEYFLSNDEWALLMSASGVNAVATPAPKVALEVLHHAVARDGFFAGMTDFKAPRHFCSFIREKNRTGERSIPLSQCEAGQRTCPYATFEAMKDCAPHTKAAASLEAAK